MGWGEGDGGRNHREGGVAALLHSGRLITADFACLCSAVRTRNAFDRSPFAFGHRRTGRNRKVDIHRSRTQVAHLVRELVDQDAVPERRLAHLRAATAVHGEPVAAVLHDLDGALCRAGLSGEDGGETSGVGSADDDTGAQAGAGEALGVLVGDHPALLQGDDVVGGACGVFGVVHGEQDRAASGGVGLEHVVQPAGLLPGESVTGGVEHEGVGAREEGAGQAEPAVHAAREGAEAFLAQADEAYGFEDFVGLPCGHSGRCAQHAEVAAHSAAGVAGHVAQEDADLAGGVGDVVQGASPEVGDSSALLEFEHESEDRGLARALGSEERGDMAHARLERDVVDGGGKVLAGDAGQSEGLDHP